MNAYSKYERPNGTTVKLVAEDFRDPRNVDTTPWDTGYYALVKERGKDLRVFDRGELMSVVTPSEVITTGAKLKKLILSESSHG